MRKTILLLIVLMNIIIAQKNFDLDKCIEIANKNNPDMKLADMEVKSAQYRIKGSYSGILPNISTGADWNHMNQGEREYYVGGVKQVQPETSSESYNLGINYHQNLYDGGAWWNQIKRAKNNYQNAIVNRKQTNKQIKAYVSQQYYKILKAKKLLDVYKSALKTSQKQLDKSKEMYELGQVARKDFLKARVKKGNDTLNIIQQKRTIKSLKNELARIMGYQENDFTIIETDYLSPADYQLNTSLKKAMEHNPGLQSLQYQKKIAQLNYNIARSNLTPTLSTNLSYSRGGSKVSRVYSDFDKFWNTSIGLNLSIPIFQGFSTRTNIEKTHIEYEKYEARINNKELEIRKNIKDLIQKLETYNEMLEVNKINLESAEEDLRAAQEMYKLESATMLEVLDAQSNLTRARGNLISTKYEAKVAEVNLRYYMGTK